MHAPAAPEHATAEACEGTVQSVLVQQVSLGMQALGPQSLELLSHAHEQDPPVPLQMGVACGGAVQSAAVQHDAAAMHVVPQTLPPEPFA